MRLTPGTKLGAYEILEAIGAGGIGEVYRAQDSKLGRDVAIKVLRRDFASDPERVRRFEQEARAASALNHPNIVTILDIGEQEDTRYIAMEYVLGKTLRDVLGEAPLPTKRILKLATQIAEGLAKAHSAGIVHRDLKPENIMVSSDGLVKILDFGLAKLRAQPSHVDSEMATMDRFETREGVVVGTVAYMSPEQAKGQTVDSGSDQFAFGAILYELATGKRPFERSSLAETVSAILKEEPEPVTFHNPSVSAQLATLIDRCLSKDPQGRYDSTRDLARDLHGIELSAPLASTVQAGPEPRPMAAVWAAGLLASIVVMIFALNVAEVRQWVGGGAERDQINSIAVLPLENLSGDPEQEYFADGMTEALITDLAKIGGLKVISRTSAMRYKGTEKPLSEIAEELGVEAVVEGSVLRVGKRVRITAQLIRGKTDIHLWAESYERDLQDVISLQGEVSRAIAREIQWSLTPELEERLVRTSRMDLKAYDAYLLGRYHWNQRSRDGLALALEYFQQAIKQDPTFARAYAGLADTYLVMEVYSRSPPNEVHPKAKAMALKALEIDPTLGEAHTSLAWSAFTYDFEWAAAEREFRQGIQLSPGYATSHHWYAIFLSAMGRFESAKTEMTQALELDPLSPVILTQQGFPFFSAGENESAVDAYRRALVRFPGFEMAHTGLTRSLVASGAYEEAIGESKLAEPGQEGLLGMAYGFLGRTREAREVLEKLAVRSRKTHVPATEYVYVYIGLGDTERALDWLERAIDERGIFVAWMKTWPLYDPLRDEPRFKALLSRMQFPE